jgi:hypothetical protein
MKTIMEEYMGFRNSNHFSLLRSVEVYIDYWMDQIIERLFGIPSLR